MTEHKRQRIGAVHLASRLLVCLSSLAACDKAERPMAPDMQNPQAGSGADDRDASLRADASVEDAGRNPLDAAFADATVDAAVGPGDDDGGAPLDPIASCAM